MGDTIFELGKTLTFYITIPLVGDISWTNLVEEDKFNELMLNEEEKIWLFACLKAVKKIT